MMKWSTVWCTMSKLISSQTLEKYERLCLTTYSDSYISFGYSPTDKRGTQHFTAALCIHSQSPEFAWRCFHGMSRGNWYSESELYAPVYHFKGFQSFQRTMACSWSCCMWEHKERNIFSWRPGVAFQTYQRKRSSPIHLPQMSALTLLRITA